MSGVATIGSLSRDVVAGGEPRPGGAVFYAARAYARLGADARIVARCGADDVAAFLPALEAFGVPATTQSGVVTTAFRFHYEGDHRVMEVETIGDPWTPDDVDGWAGRGLGDAVWVQVGALLRTDFSRTTLERLATGRRLLLDGQGLVRRAAVGPLVRDADVEPSVFASLHALKLNEDEATILAGSREPERLRALGVPEVVLTLGSSGCTVVTERHAERIDPVAVEGVVDPTGAGDSFAAGYLHYRAQGADPVEAAREANVLTASILSSRP